MRRLVVSLLAIAAAACLAALPAADQATAEPATVAPTVPNMLLPWDQSLSVVTFTSGPHGGGNLNHTCFDLVRVPDQSGLDFAMPVGQEVLAVADGQVAKIAYDSVIGNLVVVYHGGGFATQYWHLSTVDPALTEGLPITRGTVIGLSGQQNNHPHLHLEFTNWFPAKHAGAPLSADGMSIDGFTAHAFIRASDSSTDPHGFNYRGTLVRGTPRLYVGDTCGVPTLKWRGATPNDTWTWSDEQSITSSNKKNAQLTLEVSLTGIGNGPYDNHTPRHPNREGTVQVFNGAGSLVVERTTTFVYSPQRGTFLGGARLTSNWRAGPYSVKVRFPTSLRKLAANVIQVGASNTRVPGPTVVKMGDINGDNVLDILDYNIFATCYRNDAVCTAADRQASDLDDDGDVDGADYNIWFTNLQYG